MVAVGLVAAIGLFLIAAFVLQLAYNYAAPRLVHSVNKHYDANRDFSPIGYGTAVVVMILLGFVCGPGLGSAAVKSYK